MILVGFGTAIVVSFGSGDKELFDRLLDSLDIPHPPVPHVKRTAVVETEVGSSKALDPLSAESVE